MRTADLDYDLPADRIAAEPAEPRDAARLLVVDRASGRVAHRHVRDLGAAECPFRPGDLMVLNHTRVLPALISGRRRDTGGAVTGLFLRAEPAPGPVCWRVLLETRGRLRPGEAIDLAGPAECPAHLVLLEPVGGGWRARVHASLDTFALLDRVGRTPLPPYIRRARRSRGLAELRTDDATRYNTVFARDPGSVAAPTAALHFTQPLLASLERHGVRRADLTLHVGPGTFTPVRGDHVEAHAMHAEWIQVPRATLAALRAVRAAGARIVVVGTTSVRALESLPDPLPSATYTAETELFIHPGAAGEPDFPFRFTDVLLTNFHLPRSTLLALVAALPGVGIDRLMCWYRIALEAGYRFYSYGDAMLLL